jgi:hypothetical protein
LEQMMVYITAPPFSSVSCMQNFYGTNFDAPDAHFDKLPFQCMYIGWIEYLQNYIVN